MAELAENAGLREAEPGRTRFARLETEGCSRRKLDPAPVSEVRASRLSAFGTKRKRPRAGASSRVRYRIMAEREGFEPSIRFCRIHTFQACAFDHSATAPHA